MFNTAVPHRRTRSGKLVWVLHLLLLIVLPWSPAQAQLSAEPAELGEAPILSAGPVEYRPGRGLRLGSVGLDRRRVHQHQSRDRAKRRAVRLRLDRFNVFVIFDRFTRFRAVAELQLKDIFVADEDASRRAGLRVRCPPAVRRLHGLGSTRCTCARYLPDAGRLLEPHPRAAADVDDRAAADRR